MALPLASQTILLTDGTNATIHPVWNGSQLPLELVAALCVEYNAEIDRGRSFPETHRMMLENFEKSWFSGVAGVVIRGDDKFYLEDFDLLDNNECLGSFWIQPCYPGRSSHICTANFLVKSKFRNTGVGTAMGQCFLRWARQLGYDYAMLNLVYDCNVAACKILDRLGFRVLSTLRGAGILKGFSSPVDAFMFGRSLNRAYGTSGANTPATSINTPHTPGTSHSASLDTPNLAPSLAPSLAPNLTPNLTPNLDISHASQSVSHDTYQALHSTTRDQSPLNFDFAVDPSLEPTRPMPLKLSPEFEQVRVYLMEGVYPPGTTRVERTRIRSRARSYEVVHGTLMFKRTHAPVVTNAAEQARIVTALHRENHNGINKLQKRVLESYHWHGVRETIMRVIKSCPECKAASEPQVDLESEAGSAETGTSDIINFLPVPSRTVQSSDHQRVLERGQAYHSTLAVDSVHDPYNVVYLPPENEDDEYVPEDADLDLGLGEPENEENGEDEDDLFREDEDDGDWTGDFLEEDEDEEDEEDEEE